MPTFFTGPGGISQSNFWAGIKDFGVRGGFANGLNPTVVGRIWYVNANSVADRSLRAGPVGSDSNSGRSPVTPFATVARALSFVDSYDIIVVSGVVREQVVAPLGVFDVTIIGGGNLPRQATSSGVPTNGGAYWTFPSSGALATTALLTLIEQGWTVRNIAFTPFTSSPCIEGIRAEDAVHPDPSHLLIDGCAFLQGTTGIGFQDSGGLYDVIIQNSRFMLLTSAIKGVAGAGIAVPLEHGYFNNYFNQNTNDIVIGCSYGRIQNNVFKNTTTQKVDLTAGGHEVVSLNQFDNVAADIDPAHGYTGSASGTWFNYDNIGVIQGGQPA